MIELSIAQVEYLKVEVSRVGLSYSHLREDLTDHICCDVEYEMQNGLPFEKAYERVKQKVGIEGLLRVQHDTLYLIDKKYRIMKKLMKISGLIAPILLAFGALFKIMHYPGAGILLVLGFFSLSFLFLPSAIYVSYLEVSNKTRKFSHVIGFIGTFFLSLSFLFKIQHWPGAGIMMLTGMVLVCLVFIPVLIASKLKNKEVQFPAYIYVTGFTGLVIYLIGFLFKMMHWPGAAILLFGGAILIVVISFPLYVYKTYKNETHVNNSFIYLIIVIVWFILPTMLMTINISRDYLSSMFVTSKNIEVDLAFFEKTNEDYYKVLSKNIKAIELKQKTNTLKAFIKELKVKLVTANQQKGQVVRNDSSIIIERLPANEIGAYSKILFNQDQSGKKLKKELEEYQKFIRQIEPENENLKNYVDEPLENYPDKVLIASLNKLSMIELSILEAEHVALKYLAKQESKVGTIAKN